MSHNPNTVKSQDDLSTTNNGKRSSDVLLSAIDKIADLEEWKKDMQAKYGNKFAELEKTKKQLEIAVKCLKNYKSGTTDKWFAEVALEQIEELNK